MNPTVLSAARVGRLIPRRPSQSHKGVNGHVLLVAGSRGMTGAAILGGLGALRVGAGLLTIGIVAQERRTVTARLPESMTIPLPETREGALSGRALGVLDRFLAARAIDVLALGPGLSQRGEVKKVVKKLIASCRMPLVLDADGLNSVVSRDLLAGTHMIITPHPGELARLWGKSTSVISADRKKWAEKTARDLNVVCVLKGHKTIISDGRFTYINPTGNPAMATGGMGDVLTGVIAGLLAQGLPLLEAASAGAYIHGLAGDLARVSDRGLLAVDLASCIPQALKKIGLK